MESADQMEHLLLKGVRVGLLGGVEAVAVEHALVAAAGRTHVPAGVAADALGEFALPEGKALLRAHGLQLLHLGETVLGLHRKLHVRADQLVVHHVLRALADLAALHHRIPVGAGLISVDSADL